MAPRTQKSVSVKRPVNPSSPVSSSATQNPCSPSSVSPSSMMKKEDRFRCDMFGSGTPALERQNSSRKSCFACKYLYCGIAICRMFIGETKRSRCCSFRSDCTKRSVTSNCLTVGMHFDVVLADSWLLVLEGLPDNSFSLHHIL